MPTIDVFCCDDCPRLTAALERMLGLHEDLRVVGAANSTDGLAEAVRSSGAAVVLMDLTMDGADPLSVLSQLASRCPGTRAIVYSGHGDPETVDRAIEAGAWGFVRKHEPSDLLVEAIRRVAAGEVVLPRGCGA